MGWQAVRWATPPNNATPLGGPHGAAGSKHSRMLYDSLRQRVVVGGGDRDGSSAGQPNLYWFKSGVSGATLLIGTTSPGMMPAYPDNGTFAYDSLRDLYISTKPFWFGLSYAQSQQPTRATVNWATNGTRFNPVTAQWGSDMGSLPAPFGWGGDSNANFGFYDPQTDSLNRLFYDGAWGNSLQVIPMFNEASPNLGYSTYSVGSGHPSGSFLRGYLRNMDIHSHQPAFDPVDRMIYVVGQSTTVNLATGDDGWGLIKIPLSNPTLGERIMLPSNFTPQVVAAGDGRDYLLAFDTIRRKVMFPQITGFNGEVRNALIYDVASGTWETVDALSAGAPYPQGNTFIYDPSVGAGILTGGRANAAGSTLRPGDPLPAPTYYFMLTPGTTSQPATPVVTTSSVRTTAITTATSLDYTIYGDPGVYRFWATQKAALPGDTDVALGTTDSASSSLKFGDFPALFVAGRSYVFTAVHRNASDTKDIGAQVQRQLTIQGATSSTPIPIVDTTPPTIILSTPINGATVGGTIGLVYTATDLYGISLVRVSVNSVLIPTATFNTLTLPNGVARWTVEAYDNSTALNYASASSTFTVFNAPPATPVVIATASKGVRAAFLTPVGNNRVGYILWASVPSGFEYLYARPGKQSRWPNASTEEKVSVETGVIAEKYGSVERIGTDSDMQTALEVLWAQWHTEVQAVDDFMLRNAFWDGDSWTTRE